MMIYLQSTLNSLYRMQMQRTEDLFAGTEENISIKLKDEAMQRNKANLLVYIKNAKDAMQGKIGDLVEQMGQYEDLIRQLPKEPTRYPEHPAAGAGQRAHVPLPIGKASEHRDRPSGKVSCRRSRRSRTRSLVVWCGLTR
ncbi:MAG: hypothetical protein R2818_15815 [Flavobacteriales bacterium]